jgi:hypothetical protein
MKIYLKSIPFSTIRAGALIIMASVFLNRSIAKKYFIFLLFSLPFSSRIHAQNAPALEWQKSLGGSSDDRAESIQLTNDGGFITAGSSESIDGDISGNHGKNDFWVVKLDSALNILWQKSLGGSENDRPHSVQQTFSGGYIIAGQSASSDGNVSYNHPDWEGYPTADYWIVRLGASGNIAWQISLGGNDYDAAKAIYQTTDGGFIVAGSSNSNNGNVTGNHGNSDYWIVKLSDAGSLVWQKCLGGSGYDNASSVLQTVDGGIVVAGYSSSNDGDVSGNHGGDDGWIVRLDATGNIQWQKCLGGSDDDRLNSIEQTIDGGFIIAGESESNDGDVSGNHGSNDGWIVKLNVSGDIEWQHAFGGSNYDKAKFIQQTTDGGFLVAGYSESHDGDVTINQGEYDYWIVKLDSAGNMEWQKSLGGSDADEANCIRQTVDGGFIVAGASESNDGDVSGNQGDYDCWIIKYSCNVLENFYADADNDHYGNAGITVLAPACSSPTGFVRDNSDCNDTSATVYPGAAEVANGIDDNCNGYIDDPDIEWQKSLGGSRGDRAECIQQTTDGGFIVAGSSYSNDGDVSGHHINANGITSDYWIVKLDTAGSIEWEKSLGGSGGDEATSVSQTADGGYIVAGTTNSDDGDVSGNSDISDYWVVRLDQSGNIIWEKCLGTVFTDYATSVQQTADGGFIVTGSAHYDGSFSSDYWIVKLDDSGNVEWQKSLGGSDTDAASSIQQTTDNGYIVAGASESNDEDVSGNHGNFDYWIVKLNVSGEIIWQKCLGGNDGSNWGDVALSIQQTTDAGYIVVGYSNSNNGDVSGNHGNFDYWIVKLDATGIIIWQKSMGGSGADYGTSVAQTANGGLLVAGYSESHDGDVTINHGEHDYWIVKLNATQNIIWQKSLGGSNYDQANSIQQTADGGFIIAGNSNSKLGDVSGNHGENDYWIVKLSCDVSQVFYSDSDGDGFGNAGISINAPACFPPSGYAFDSTDCDDTNANVYPGAQEIPSNNIDDDCNGYIDDVGVGIGEITSTSFFTIFPNPANNQTTIQFTLSHLSQVSVSVFDLSGKKLNTLVDQELQQGNHLLQLNTTQFSKGIYFVRMISIDGIHNEKLIIQ